MRDAWEILGIAPTENKRAIKRAYAKLLAKYHPEEHPDEFIEIQNAYQSILNSLERDYQKPESLSMDLTEGFRKKDSVYLNAPFVETNAKDDFENGFPQQHPSSYSDTETIHDEKPKQEDEALYDDLDLSWSFQNQDNTVKKQQEQNKTKQEYTKEVYGQEDIEIKQNTKNQDLNEYLYLRFEERIKFSCRVDVMKELILNQTFFDAVGDKQFYLKIIALICRNYRRLDSVTISFLYDAFSYIETNKGYAGTKENSITSFIAAEKLREQKEKVRKQKAEKRNTYIFAICFILFIFGAQFFRQQERTKQRIQEDKSDRIYNEIIANSKREEEAMKEASRQNKDTLEAHMLETYSSAYTCTLMNFYTKPNSSIIFNCTEVQNEENQKSGQVKVGEDRLITEIALFEELITTEE